MMNLQIVDVKAYCQFLFPWHFLEEQKMLSWYLADPLSLFDNASNKYQAKKKKKQLTLT